MSAPRYPYWITEQSATYRGLTSGGMLSLAVVVVLVVLLLSAVPTAQSGAQPTRPTTPPACARHWPPTCDRAR